MGYMRVMMEIFKKRKIKCSREKVINYMHVKIDTSLFLNLLFLELIQILHWDIIDDNEWSKFKPGNLTVFATRSTPVILLLLPGLRKGSITLWRVNMSTDDAAHLPVIDHLKLRYPTASIKQLKHLQVNKFVGQFRLYHGLTRITEEYRQLNGVPRKSVTNLFDVSDCTRNIIFS